MERPELSSQFTVEDIHKLREYFYDVTKNMPLQERLNYCNTMDGFWQGSHERDSGTAGKGNLSENKQRYA